ncbi:MAG: Lpg1974 family pore-forming outer membrane protein [Thermoguttaceae bacterium]|jgi:hypothetical protein|nr:Lpg1974 family pore-forming outer membrane protein [Thermoguttaceae bacterium]
MNSKWVILFALVGMLGSRDACLAQHWGIDPTAQAEAYSATTGSCCECSVPFVKGYGEFLLLRPSNDKVSYAVPINGAITDPSSGVAPVQIGRESVLDIGYNVGFRGGIEVAVNECSSIGAVYTLFESTTSGSVALDAPPPDVVLRSLINHPGTVFAPTDFLEASGRHDIDFRLADVEYRGLWLCGPQYSVSGVVGVRYAQLEQGLTSEFRNVTTVETVTSDINFEGGGVRLGLEAEQYAGERGLFGYGKTYASFLAGEFSSRYTQSDTIRELVVDAGWKEDRVVPILDLEIGVGWVSRCGLVRVTAGYMYSAWLNTLTTGEFIQAVQNNNSVSVRETLVFDGLVGRAEIRY